MKPLFILSKFLLPLFNLSKYFLYGALILIPSLIILYILVVLYPYIFPYNILTTEMYSSYISNSNRVIIFILGLTVSANIYLYTMRNKVSSSIMLSSKQIGFLTATISLNLVVLFLGNSLTTYEFVFDYTAENKYLKLGLFVYWFLAIMSTLLFIATLYKFITGFKIDKNISKAVRDIDRKIYPVNIVRVYDETAQIFRNSLNFINRYIEMNFKKKGIMFQYSILINKYSWLKYFGTTLKIVNVLIISTFFAFKIIITRKNQTVVRTYSYSNKEIEKINLKVEIYCQNLEYVVKQNSNKSMNKHFNNWNATFGQLIVLTFHIKTFEKDSSEISRLYKDLLNHNARLIIATSKNYEHQYYYKQLLTSMFKGLAYQEEAYFNVPSSKFEIRTTQLEEIYFNELFLLFVSLIKEEEFDFLNLLQTEGLSINSFMYTNKENEKYYGDKSRKERYEQLFLSLLIKMIELNITNNLSTVMAILLSLNEKPAEVPKSSDTPLLTDKKQKNTQNKNDPRNHKLNLSHQNKLGLYYAAIKANELENYKAAGYIIKVLSSNLDHSSISKVILEIEGMRAMTKAIHYDTGIYKVDFNDYSFNYCADKTFVLMNAQYFSKGDFILTEELIKIFNEIRFSYFIEKLETKQKEYNMIAISDKSLNNFKELINPTLLVAIENKI